MTATAKDIASGIASNYFDRGVDHVELTEAITTALLAHGAAERARAIEECAKRADDEEEPPEGELPPEIIAKVLAGDTVYVERAMIAAVRTTKRCIAVGIRTLASAATGREVEWNGDWAHP